MGRITNLIDSQNKSSPGQKFNQKDAQALEAWIKSVRADLSSLDARIAELENQKGGVENGN